MTATTDLAALRAQHAARIREEALRICEFAGYVIARVDAGHPEATGLYAADITAAGQRIMTAHAAVEALDILAASRPVPR